MPVKHLSNSSASIIFQTVHMDLSTRTLKFNEVSGRCLSTNFYSIQVAVGQVLG